MTKRPDRRVAKSKKAIKTAFLELLMSTGLDNITVKDITEKADVSRKTFYLHYTDKFDLLNTIVNQHLDELQEICDQEREKDFVEGTIVWFRYFERHKAFFAALFTAENTIAFHHRLLRFIMKQLDIVLGEREDRKNTEVLRRFMGTAVLGVVESYVLDQFRTDVDQIAEQVGELLKQIIRRSASGGRGLH